MGCIMNPINANNFILILILKYERFEHWQNFNDLKNYLKRYKIVYDWHLWDDKSKRLVFTQLNSFNLISSQNPLFKGFSYELLITEFK